MFAYESFAEVYDEFMSDIPYDEWVCYIQKIWEKYSAKPKLVAELGCGTGNITERLANLGYDMIGIDYSENMLSKARQKAKDNEKNILYLEQDMREFELFGTVDSIICLCDSINYILEEDELLSVFKLANNYLEPQGLFIFDLNTIHKFKDVLGCNSFSQTNENAAYTWENYFDEEDCVNEYYTNFFIKDEETGLYRRFEEEHYEKGYSIQTIKALIEKAGMDFVAVFDEMTFSLPNENSERIYFVAREKGKKKIEL